MDNLNSMREELSAVPVLKNKLSALKKSLREQENICNELLAKYKAEKKDVENMEKSSFTSFVLKTMGKYDDKLDKELREEIEAKLLYDEAVNAAEELKYEISKLQIRLNRYADMAGEYNEELQKRRKFIEDNREQPEAKEYHEIEEEMKLAYKQITEVNEALSMVKRVKGSIYNSAESLETARKWASYDIWGGGGIISHAAKYSHIDDAENNFNNLNSQLRRLQIELNDVDGVPDEDFTYIGSGQRMVDYWFDNIFTDISVRGKIDENLEKLTNLENRVQGIEKFLTSKRQNLDSSININKAKQEDLLVSMNNNDT